MTFTEEFSALEHKSLNQIIATKIHKELSELRSHVDTSPTIPKRWVWELIQNAKDVNIGGKVQVHIEADLEGPDAHVTFSHNGGRVLTVENIRFLIEQVSSKSRTKDSTGRPMTTGKFGTGFLTTHLLSPYVLVTGVAKQPGLLPRKFELYLDRSGTELEEIIAAVEAAKKSTQTVDKQPHYKEYVAGEFNTAFRYELTDDTGKSVAQRRSCRPGHVPAVHARFVPEIESVAYPDHMVSLEEPEEERVDGEVQILSVTTTDFEGESVTSTIAVLSKGLTTIAMPVEADRRGRAYPPAQSRSAPVVLRFSAPRHRDSFRSRSSSTTRRSIRPDARDGLFLTQTRARRPAERPQQSRHQRGALALSLTARNTRRRMLGDSLHLIGGRKADPRWAYLGESELVQGSDPQADAETPSCTPR